MKFQAFLRPGLLLLALTLFIHIVAPPRGESVFAKAVWRVQLHMTSGPALGAAPVADLRVSLNSQNETWLTYLPGPQRDDTFDLLLTNVNKLGDITDLLILIGDQANWCPQTIELLINETPYFQQSLHCPWTNHHRGMYWYVVRRGEIHKNRPILLAKAQDELTLSSLQSLVETAVSQAVHEDGVLWGHMAGRTLSVSLINRQILHIELSLATGSPYPVHVSWDIRLQCQTDRLTATIENYLATVTTMTMDDLSERNLGERMQWVDTATAYLRESLTQWSRNGQISGQHRNDTIALCSQSSTRS